MRRGCIARLIAAIAASTPLIPVPARAACQVAKMAELPVKVTNMQPLVVTQINGRNALFLADTGAAYSMMSGAAASEFQLSLYPAPFGILVGGVGGDIRPSIARVREFGIAGAKVHDLEFLVGGSESGAESVGILGQNVFRIADVEFDLANGTISFMRTEDCRKAGFAYWAKPGEAYSVVDLDPPTDRSPTAYASLNGAKIHITFDSGAMYSMLSLRAAERAGVKSDSPGVEDGGYASGVGRRPAKTYIGRFDSFRVGDEEIRNARLRFGDIGALQTDMLLGADFFLSHRIFIASHEHRVFFTFNGGKVFDLSHAHAADPASPNGAARATDAPPAADGTTSAPSAGGDTAAGAAPRGSPSVAPDPKLAAEAARRGEALASRRDFDPAIEQLTRACQLDPAQAEYPYRRGLAYAALGKGADAAADFDHALALDPNAPAVLIARAELRLEAKNESGAIEDIDRAARVAPRESNIRFELGVLYARVSRRTQATDQYDMWLHYHGEDAHVPQALEHRCLLTAYGDESERGVRDCNDALKRTEKGTATAAELLTARGFARLRLGDLDHAIGDFDAAIKASPADATALFGRGIAKRRKSHGSDGATDIAAAVKAHPEVETFYADHGVPDVAH